MVFALLATQVQAQTTYQVSIDLNDTRNDQLSVEIMTPEVKNNSVEYHMPKVVPGTYSISDFGRLVTDFQALDKKGRPLAVERLSTNRWNIADAKNLVKITYRIHDSYDKAKGYKNNPIFEPGGTNIEGDRQVFILNTFGIVGYLQGMKSYPYEVAVIHPEEIYGATSLKRKSASATSDTFSAQNYNSLVDAPIMYCKPDTITQTIAGANIIVSVFSPNDQLTARDVMNNLKDLMEAQSQYLGGALPVDRYAYLIYLSDESSLSGAWGALEHSYSSLYYLPESNPQQLKQTVRDVAAHEFFHIVTPLSIHSEEIHNFNYIEPEMSQHLWLYEGVTEYSASHVQVKYGLITPDQYLETIREKLQVAEQFPAVSFTVMSKNILEPDYEDMFINVYNRGALIAMCLDLYLIKYSNGEKNLQWLMRALAEKYGINEPFKDEDLFGVIESLTYPEIGEFLRMHVEGDEPLPIARVLGWAGIKYAEELKIEINTLGQVGIGINEQQQLVIADVSNLNAFGKKMGYQKDDILISVNGGAMTLASYKDTMAQFERLNAGEEVTVVVEREGKQLPLRAPVTKVSTSQEHVMTFTEETANSQIPKSWLGLP